MEKWDKKARTAKIMQIPFKYFGAGSIPAQAWALPAENRALFPFDPVKTFDGPDGRKKRERRRSSCCSF
jgi:hypothetical protein